MTRKHREYQETEILHAYKIQLSAIDPNNPGKLPSLLKHQKRVLPQEEWPPDIKRAAKFIHEHIFDRRLTVGWMKEQCHINGKSFSGKFKLYLGLYPKQYIIHHRIEASKILLLKTKSSITTIAIAVGYSLQSSYCKTFENKEGILPSEWREQNS